MLFICHFTCIMTEVMADLDGRWLGLSLSSESWVILEAPRGSPDHIKTMSCLNKASQQERDLLSFRFINHGLLFFKHHVDFTSRSSS